MEVLAPDDAGIARAAELIRAGEVVAFPTDTVYGLAALPASADRIYAAKSRPADKQLIAMAAEAGALERLVEIVEPARRLMERHWPGALTLVLPTRSGKPPTLGVRVPDHPVALALLRALGEPVLTTSANLAGEPPALTAAGVRLPGWRPSSTGAGRPAASPPRWPLSRPGGFASSGRDR
ncbi:MAG: L-threonylcarbamoyladenylate synthase [Chloroflexota bacterium]